MGRVFLHLLNGAWLVIVLVGVPSVTSCHLVSVRVTSLSAWQGLTLWGLGLAVAANLLASWLFAKGRKTRRALLAWGCVHAGFFAVEYLLFAGYINFEWLEKILRSAGG